MQGVLHRPFYRLREQARSHICPAPLVGASLLAKASSKALQNIALAALARALRARFTPETSYRKSKTSKNKKDSEDL
jgi:hypothetical protein